MRRTVKLNLPLHHFAPLNQHFDFPILIPHIRSDSLLSLAYLTTLRIVRYGSPARLCLRHTARSGPLLTRYARSIRGPHLSRRLRRLAPPNTNFFVTHCIPRQRAFPLYPLPSKPPPLRHVPHLVRPTPGLDLHPLQLLRECTFVMSFVSLVYYALLIRSAHIPSKPLLSHNYSEQRKLRIYNGFRHLGYEIIVKNFV